MKLKTNWKLEDFTELKHGQSTIDKLNSMGAKKKSSWISKANPPSHKPNSWGYDYTPHWHEWIAARGSK